MTMVIVKICVDGFFFLIYLQNASNNGFKPMNFKLFVTMTMPLLILNQLFSH